VEIKQRYQAQLLRLFEEELLEPDAALKFFGLGLVVGETVDKHLDPML
jgi:hypothetical protein